MNNLVTIIIPVFKAQDFIERCAVSLLEQTYENIEYYFVNDCTPDDSIIILQRVISRYPQRVPSVNIINFETNQGHAHARNVALKLCRGEYVIQIDADDWVETDLVEIMLKEAVEANADITCCGFWVEYTNNREEHYVNSEDIGRKGLSEFKFILDYSAHWNKLVKLSLIRDNNIYCIEGTNNWVDVGQVVPLRFAANKIVAVQKCLYHYNACNENSVSKHVTEKRLDDMVKIAKAVTDFIDNHSTGEFYIQSCYLKFFAKAPMITGKLHQYKRWRETFPEVNKYIRLYPVDKYHKIMYILSTHHLSCIYELSKMVNKIFKL